MKNIKALKEERGSLLDELAGLQNVIEREARSILKMRDEQREIDAAEQSKADADIIKLIAIRYKNY